MENNTVWYQHEALDRVSMLIEGLHSALGYTDTPHPGVWNEECLSLLGDAYMTLGTLYQKIGEWEEYE